MKRVFLDKNILIDYIQARAKQSLRLRLEKRKAIFEASPRRAQRSEKLERVRLSTR